MDSSYQRRSKNEEELFLFVLPTLQEASSSQSSQRQAIHTSVRNGATFIDETQNGHEVLCQRRFHMERDIFRALVRRLREKGLVDSSYVSVEEQLAIFLYAVSKNASRRFAAVLNALTQLTCHYICLPSPHPHRILRQPKFSPYFQVIIKIVHFHANLTIFNTCKVGLLY
jgi:hypothetical protein